MSRSYKPEVFTIKVNHLSGHVTESSLQRYYSQFGEVSSVKVNSSSKESFAYVNFYDKSSAKKAQKRTDGQTVLGCVVSVILKTEESSTRVPSTQYTLKVNNLSDSVDESDLEDICSEFDGFQSVKVNSGYAYVNFTNRESAQEAMEHMNKLNLGGQEVIVKFHQPELQAVPSRPPPPPHQRPFQPRSLPSQCPPIPFQRPPMPSQFPPIPSQYPPAPFQHPVQCHPPTQYTLKVNNLSDSVDESDLEDICSEFDGFQSVKVNSGYAYVNFTNRESAQEAMEHMNKLNLGGQEVIVKFHQPELQAVPSRPPPPPHQRPFQPRSLPSQCPPIPFQRPPMPSQFPPIPSQYPPAPFQHPVKCHPPTLRFQRPPVPSHKYAVTDQFSGPVPHHYPAVRNSMPHVVHPQYFPPTVSSSTTCTIKATINGNEITSKDLEHYFGQFGEIVQKPSIYIGNPNFAYINFKTNESAIKASKISKFTLKGVKIMVKLSDKRMSLVPEKDSKEIKSDDPLINQMMATVCFKELEEIIDKAVILKPSKNGGVIISGDSDKVKLAESIINLQMEVFKPQITSQTHQFHSKYIPLLANPLLFQKVENKHAVDFSVLTSDGTSKSMVAFSSTVAALSAKPDAMKLDALIEYLSPDLSKSLSSSFWQFMDDTETYVAMSPTDSAAVERLYQSVGARGVCHHSVGKWNYSYDFQAMTQTNLSTLKIRSIKRITCPNNVRCIVVSCRGLFNDIALALNDLQQDLDQNMTQSSLKVSYQLNREPLVKLASSFCVEVESSYEDKIILKGQKIYLEKVLILLQKKQLELQAKHQTLNSITSGVSYPSEWEPQSDEIELKSVLHGSKEWSNVEADMKKSMPGVRLIKVERIQNKGLWEKYNFCKRRLYIKNRSDVNEMRLFHGTRTNPPEKIYRSEHGFDFRFGSSGMWGRGAYFAVNASYSSNYAYRSVDPTCSGRQIFMAYVLTGDSKKMRADSSLVVPPCKEGRTDERYDSVNGDSGTSQIYVVYDHDKSYPAYLITF